MTAVERVLYRTRRLDPAELRVLGSLMEKEQATPDLYPLTVNSLIAACNQKSNREPVTELTEEQVRDALGRLRKDVLAWRTDTSRVARWEHRLSSRWRLDAEAKALLTVLILRGAQTPGELRGRSERLHSFAEVAEVEAKLQELASGVDPLVRELAREPGQRENRWGHVMAAMEEGASTTPASTIGKIPEEGFRGDWTPAANSDHSDRLARLERELAEIAARVARLEQSLRD